MLTQMRFKSPTEWDRDHYRHGGLNMLYGFEDL